MLLFSATFEDSVWKFAQKVVPDPNIIKLKREEETLDTIKQYYVLCNNRDEKFQALCNLYGAITIAQAMIFCHVSSSGRSSSGGLACLGRGSLGRCCPAHVSQPAASECGGGPGSPCGATNEVNHFLPPQGIFSSCDEDLQGGD